MYCGGVEAGFRPARREAYIERGGVGVAEVRVRGKESVGIID